MQNSELKQALSDVSKALDKVNKAFGNRLHQLREKGGDSAKIHLTTDAVRSMQDSAAMYLAWAYHYSGIPQSDE